MEVTVSIEKRIGAIGEARANGWTKELNIVSWNGNPAKYDIRDWDAEHERMSRGITLSEEEAKALYQLLKSEFEEAK